MKLAIHFTPGGFSDRWIHYCQQNNIPYKVVDCYNTNIVEDLKDCNALMWHHNHALPKDQLFAKQLMFSLEESGMVVFPDFNTAWHFDDKLGQKYLFETLELPAVKAYAFFSKKEAKKWIETTDLPKVFKLRRGAGSRNVWLVKTKSEAKRLINKAFGRGFRQYDAWGAIKENYNKLKQGKSTFKKLLKAAAHLIYPLALEKSIGKERGYVYFQDFIPDNDCDIRIIVVQDKAFAIRRNVRKNDFRASGSGLIEYEKHHFSDETVRLAFNMAEKMKSACVGFDFVYDNGKPMILEVSYGFNKYVYDSCTGYWDKDLNWHPGEINPYGWMVENVISKVNEQRKNK